MCCRDTEISDIDFNKRIDARGVQFFIAGVFCDAEKFIEAYFSGDEVELNVDALIHENGEVYNLGVDNKKVFKDVQTKYEAIGSGSAYALAAMDMGATAKEAVKIASNRDVYTGGRIRTFKIKRLAAS